MKATPLVLRAILLFPAALTSGCAASTHGSVPQPGRDERSGTTEEFAGDRDLAALFVLRGIETELRDGCLRVRFDLENTTPGDLAIEWAIEWKDRNGLRVDAGPRWQAAHISGQGSQSIDATAPLPGAVAFQLHMRRPIAR
jgi:hypothetical protein